MGRHDIVIAAVVALFLFACTVLVIQAKIEAEKEKRRRGRETWISGPKRKVSQAKRKTKKVNK